MRHFFIACLGLVLLTVPAVARETADDLRRQAVTSWDYQPGQGPQTARRTVRDGDFFDPFRPDSKSDVKAAPPKPIKKDDWRDPPSTQERLPVEVDNLGTKTSVDLGVQLSSYHYHEKDARVKLNGPNYGLTYAATRAFDGNWFLCGDGRLTGASLEYKGSGTNDYNWNFIADMRASVGYDFLTRDFAVSPYVGLGYRYLHSDLRGKTSTGAQGYRRDSYYFYLPVGFQQRLRLPNGSRLSMTAEFDYLLDGQQDMHLSDASSTYPDLRAEQKGGYGLRGEMMYEEKKWAVGPYVRYWNINQSTTACGTIGSTTTCAYEPHNHTLEYGLQFRYRFYDFP